MIDPDNYLDSHRALVELAISRFGRLDVAVNSAALEARGPIEAFDEATYTRVFDANVKGMFFAMKAQCAAMRLGGGGSIVNLSSTGGSRGMANMSIYVASKHAVEGLSRTAALELASANIRVNVVAPGPTLSSDALARVSDGHLRGVRPSGSDGTRRHRRGGRASDRVGRVRRSVLRQRCRAAGERCADGGMRPARPR